jgi:DNA polymerase-4
MTGETPYVPSVSDAADTRHTPRLLHVLHVRFHLPGGAAPGADAYEHLLGLVSGFTPVVEALPPDAALADVRGSLRYFGQDAAGLALLLRVRALAQHGADCTIGIAATPQLARLASREAAPGTVRTVPGDPRSVAAFLDPLPPAALRGVGPATVKTLATYGLVTLGRIAATPLGTLQRIVGASAGYRLYEQARGVDPASVTPNAPARALAAEHRFGRDELDPVQHRRALLALTEEIGARLRAGHRAAGALTLTVHYADRSTTVRTRTLAEPTGHSPDLTALAYRLYASLGLQRARVRAVALRAEGLIPAELVSRQLAFDPGGDRARRIEAVADRARAKFGPRAIRPATLSDAA